MPNSMNMTPRVSPVLELKVYALRDTTRARKLEFGRSAGGGAAVLEGSSRRGRFEPWRSVLALFAGCLLLGAACAGGELDPATTSPVPVYTEPVVLFVSPDSAEVAALHRQLADDFYIVADDAMWYRAAAYELVDSLRIPRVEVERGEGDFLVGSELRRFGWRDTEFLWFLVVYDGRTEPSIVADIDFPQELERLAL